uniref:Putative angiomotin n=1 Tax=Anopheles marajoara TaxID=58244 RepID=A0A2M4BBE6_9DIPT
MSQNAGGGAGGAAALRYSQYATGAGVACPLQQPSAATAASHQGTGASLVAMRQPGSVAQQGQQQHFMRPPMLVTSSGASMLPPGGGSAAAGPQQPPHTGSTPAVASATTTTNTASNGSGSGGLPKYPGGSSRDLSGSDTDVSTSNENLSREERYVLSHARVEPQGEENLQGNVTPVNELQGRYIGDKFSSNTSSDSTRYATPTGGSSRSISESRSGTGTMYSASMGGGGGGGGPGAGPGNDGSSNRSSMAGGGGGGGGSNRNSLKEPNSNRSSMDVSQSSYNTLIIHDDIYGGAGGMNGSSVSAREYAGSPPPYMKKERPRSYGEACQVVMQEISEIPEEYLSQSHVLKHLAKEVKLLPGTAGVRSTRSASLARDTMASEGKQRHGPRQHQQQTGSIGTTDGGDCKKLQHADPDHQAGQAGNGKLKSKSQPDLTRLYDIEPEELEALVKENHLLKQQLNNCYLKVAKSQKLEQEIANIYRVHEELVQSCDRRERLERAARTRLQQDCRRLQELNRAFRDQVEVYQSQLHASSDHQLGRTQQDVLISQLVNQNKSLVDANRRQCIELQAQNATLEEQRIHINVLDTALKRLEEECRQKQVYVERCAQLQHALQSLQNASERREQAERKLRIDYEHDMQPNRSGSSSTSSETDNLKWQLREKDAQIMRLEAECSKLEQRNLEESNVRNVAKLAMERNSQETERILAEAKQEKIRYLDEAHAANRKVTELQTRLKLVENRLAEKDAMIRAYQGQKIYGGSTNSYGSYNLSTDSFALNPLGAYNSQPSYVDVSASSYDVVSATNGAGSLLDPSVVGPYVGATSAAVVASSYASTYGQNNPSFVQSSLNLPGGSSGSAVGSSVGLNGVGGGGGGSATGCYSSPSSSSTTSNYCSSSTNYGSGTTTTGSSEHTIFDSKNYDAQRKSIDDQLKQLDEQLLNKVSELSMVEKQHQRSQRARALAMAKFKSAATASGGGSSGLGTSVTSSSANSSTDSNGNLLLAAAVGSSVAAAAAAVTNPAITRHHPASSSPASNSTNLLARGGQRAASQQQQQANGGTKASSKAQKHHHHQHQNLRHTEQAMAKTISTPAICGGSSGAATTGGSSSKKAVTTVTIGTGTTGGEGLGAATNQPTKKPRAAVSCKNVSTSATDSSTSLSSSSEPETFY